MNNQKCAGIFVFFILFIFSMGLALSGEIHNAVKSGNIEKIREILDKNPDSINAKDNNGMTPIMYAIINNKIDIVKLFIEKKADVNIKNKEGYFPLHLLLGRFVKVYNPSDPLCDKKGFVSIMQGKSYANIKLFELLLSGGAEIDCKDYKLCTPLMYACNGFGNEKIVNILIEKGADINAKNNLDWTPLIFAAGSSCPEVVKLLIKNGANINVKSKNCYTPLINMAYSYWADAPESKEIVEMLISGGADVNEKDMLGNTPLSITLRNSIVFDKNGSVLIRKNKKLAEVLVINGADVNIVDYHGFTPLLYAARARDKVLLDLLISKGADINIIDKENGENALHLAIMDFYYSINNPFSNKESIVKFIRKPDINNKELSYLIEFLISKGIDVNGKDKHGKTPLYYAKKGGNKDTVEVLLKHGAKE